MELSEKLSCAKCGHNRQLRINAKCNDACGVSIDGDIYDGYVPETLNLGHDEEVVDLVICANCGYLYGKWPLCQHILRSHIDAKSSRIRDLLGAELLHEIGYIEPYPLPYDLLTELVQDVTDQDGPSEKHETCLPEKWADTCQCLHRKIRLLLKELDHFVLLSPEVQKVITEAVEVVCNNRDVISPPSDKLKHIVLNGDNFTTMSKSAIFKKIHEQLISSLEMKYEFSCLLWMTFFKVF